MAFIPIAIMVASTAMAAYGAVQQGKVANQNDKAQQSAENYNAAIDTQKIQIPRVLLHPAANLRCDSRTRSRWVMYVPRWRRMADLLERTQA